MCARWESLEILRVKAKAVHYEKVYKVLNGLALSSLADPLVPKNDITEL